MSVGQEGDLCTSKSSRPTFFEKIGWEPGQSRSLYKIPWSSPRSTFLMIGDDERSGSPCITILSDIRGTDVGTDFKSHIGTDCEVAPEPALTISEGSRGPTKESGSFFSLSWVKGPSS